MRHDGALIHNKWMVYVEARDAGGCEGNHCGVSDRVSQHYNMSETPIGDVENTVLKY